MFYGQLLGAAIGVLVSSSVFLFVLFLNDTNRIKLGTAEWPAVSAVSQTLNAKIFGEQGPSAGKGFFGVVVLWCCGVVVLWCCGVVVLWCCGVVVLWCCGVVVLWCCVVVLLCRCVVVSLCLLTCFCVLPFLVSLPFPCLLPSQCFTVHCCGSWFVVVCLV
jgi:hypothetical protein